MRKQVALRVDRPDLNGLHLPRQTRPLTDRATLPHTDPQRAHRGDVELEGGPHAWRESSVDRAAQRGTERRRPDAITRIVMDFFRHHPKGDVQRQAVFERVHNRRARHLTPHHRAKTVTTIEVPYIQHTVQWIAPALRAVPGGGERKVRKGNGGLGEGRSPGPLAAS